MTRKKKRKTRQKSHTPFKLFLLTCFFLSGATSLSLEVSWSKELSYLLGVDIYAAATVVTAFMAGLGLGAVLAARLYKRARASIKTYALLQLVIGVCGLISIPLFRATLPLFSFLYDTLNYSGPLFLTARFLIVFILMLTPVTLMGMTLPVVVGGLFGKVKGRFSSLAGLLYGVNTMGAVTGTLLAGFYLIPEIGILKTCLFTGVVDLLIGVVVFLMDRKGKMIPRPGKIAPTRRGLKTGSPGAPDAPGEAGAVASRLYSWPAVVFMFSGMAALAYEIIWFRLLARVIGPSVHAFSIMLSIYLLGIGLGSITGARWVRKTDKHRPAMAILLFIIAVGPLVPLLFVNHLPVWYGRLFGALSGETFSIWLLVIQGGIASLLILPATFPLGALFPFVTRAYHMEIGREDNRAERTVGRLYFYNTAGGVVGSLLAGFLLLPTLGVKWSLVLACGVSLALSLMIFYTVFNGSWMRKAACCGGILAAVVVFVFSAPDLDHTILNAGMYADMLDKEKFKNEIESGRIRLGKLLYFQEGINNSVAVLANKFDDGNLTLHLTGHWVSTTELHGRLHLQFLGHLPMLFAQQRRTVGVIGFGAGITTGAALRHPEAERVNVFELEPGLIHAENYFEHFNNRPLEDPRTRLYMVDGRSHITYEKIKYDVITADPIHPFVAGAGNLYTRDFYDICRQKLNDGGLFCQWIPLIGLSRTSYDAILNTMRDVFPHIALFSFFGESVVLASETPIRVNWEEFEKRFHSPSVLADFKAIDINDPYNILAFYLGGEEQIDEYLAEVNIINTDDNVWLEHRIPIDLYTAARENLFFDLQARFKEKSPATLKRMLPGFYFYKMREALAGLSRHGDRYYEMAKKAREENDHAALEDYLRKTNADFNSKYYYTAGMELAELLSETNRAPGALTILRALQKNHPAFPDAYNLEARLLMAAKDIPAARDALDRGLKYNPDNPDLLKRRAREEGGKKTSTANDRE